jgi:hypothetical protein
MNQSFLHTFTKINLIIIIKKYITRIYIYIYIYIYIIVVVVDEYIIQILP